MLEEIYVTFEQAKALKELGFPQESFIRYIIHEFNTSKDDITTHKNVGEIFHLNYVSDNPNNLQNYCTADRPTLSLVQKWLREEKDIYLNIDCYPDYSRWLLTDYNMANNYHCKLEYNSYEKALSAGIDKCIEILNHTQNGSLDY